MSAATKTHFVIAIEFVLIITLAGYVFYKFSECGCYKQEKPIEKDDEKKDDSKQQASGLDPDTYAKITEDNYNAVPPRDPIAYGKQELRVYIDDEYLPRQIESFKGKSTEQGVPFNITLNAEARPI